MFLKLCSRFVLPRRGYGFVQPVVKYTSTALPKVPQLEQVKLNEKVKVAVQENWFQSLNLAPQLLTTINQLGWKYPTTVQYQTIPLTLSGKNIVASSWTGQGKTFCYLFPILTQLIQTKPPLATTPEQGVEMNQDIVPTAIILTPSTELAKQVYSNFQTFAKNTSVQVGVVNNSLTIERQLEVLSTKKVDVLVTTPGRLYQLLLFTNKSDSETKSLNLPKLRLTKLKQLVIDEVDKLLSLGHLPEVLESWNLILADVNNQKKLVKEGEEKRKKVQVLMYSATLIKEVHGLVLKLAPQHKLVDLNSNFSVPKTVKQIVYKVSSKRKLSLLLYLLRRKGTLNFKDQKVLLFTRTIQRCERLVENLKSNKFQAAPFHSDLSPTQRTTTLDQFNSNQLPILVTTDLVTRGIDFQNLNYVFNYDLPLHLHDYVHRVGRTGRLHNTGTAISLVSKDIELITRPNAPDAQINEAELLDQLHTSFAQDANSNGSKLEIRKIPGPFLDVDKHYKLKSTLKDTKYKSLLHYVDLDHQLDRWKQPQKKLEVGKVDYTQLIHKFEAKLAKKKGVILTKRDRNSSLTKR